METTDNTKRFKTLIFRKLMPAGSILLILLLISGCYDFDYVNQPYTADPNSYFDVQISVDVDVEQAGNSTQPLFGVLLPIGWTVDDTLFYSNVTTGDTLSMTYSAEKSQYMETIDPPPEEYFWWVGLGEDQEYPGEENFYTELRVYTNDKTGSFLLDYMLGDRYENGINYCRSNNHYIGVDAPESITVTNTNDNGPGSFRSAIDNVEYYGEINFDIDPSDTLVLDSELNIYKNLTITGPEEGNLVISGNNEVRVLKIVNQNVSLSNLTIINGHSATYGGGIYAQGASLELSNIIVKNNISTEWGGGIRSSGNIVFDTVNKCSIYDNFAPFGNDLYIVCSGIVALDTFSVLNPTSFHAWNTGNLSFDIGYGKHEQTVEDLYVSPNGSNLNSGLSFDEPLKTINLAFSISLANEQNKQVIFLDSGEYKSSTQGAYYPFTIPNYVCLQGLSKETVILDAENKSQVIKIIDNPETALYELTIKGGRSSGGYGDYYSGGGIHCEQSNLTLQKVNIINNYGFTGGGGISIRDSHVNIIGVLVDNNTSSNSWGGGIRCSDSQITIKESVVSNNHATSYGTGGGLRLTGGTGLLENVLISGNTAGSGGGIYCYGSNPTIINSAIVNNAGGYEGGGIYLSSSNPQIINTTISQNQLQYSDKGGGIYCIDSDPTLINTIVWDNDPNEIYCDYIGPPVPSIVTVSMSNIMGGEEGIAGPVAFVNWLEGNINADPLFTGTGKHPYSLSNESPCVNSGTPDTTGLNLPELDLAGNPRVYGGRIEMGAYENQEVIVKLDEIEGAGNNLDVVILPNPVQSIVHFEYELSEPSDVILEITDQQGHHIETLIACHQDKGKQKVSWDASHFSSGIYFCRFQVGSKLITRKIVKVD